MHTFARGDLFLVELQRQRAHHLLLGLERALAAMTSKPQISPGQCGPAPHLPRMMVSHRNKASASITKLSALGAWNSRVNRSWTWDFHPATGDGESCTLRGRREPRARDAWCERGLEGACAPHRRWGLGSPPLPQPLGVVPSCHPSPSPAPTCSLLLRRGMSLQRAGERQHARTSRGTKQGAERKDRRAPASAGAIRENGAVSPPVRLHLQTP